MDKETLSQYGWVVIVILVLVIMIALASPFGNFVADNFSSAYTSFGNITDDAFASAGLSNSRQEPPATFKTGVRYRFLDGSNSTFEFKDAVGDMDTAIVLHYPGFDDFEVPKLCVINITDTSFTLATSGMYPDYDGTYTIYPDGFVEKDGTIVAKSEEKWVDLEPGEYLITYGKDLYTSEDGNTPIDLALAYSDIEAMYADFEDFDNEENRLHLSYDLTKSRTPNGSLTLYNIYDALVFGNLNKDIIFSILYKRDGSYPYRGGIAKNTLSNGDLVTTGKWDWSNVTEVKKMSFYKVIDNDTSIKVKPTDTLCGVYTVSNISTYYYNNVQTTNIFFVNDYAFSYIPGMTAEEWFNTPEFSRAVPDDSYNDVLIVSLDDINGNYTMTLIDEYRDTPVEEAVFNVYNGRYSPGGFPTEQFAQKLS